jgi:hypothetical protein
LDATASASKRAKITFSLRLRLGSSCKVSGFFSFFSTTGVAFDVGEATGRRLERLPGPWDVSRKLGVEDINDFCSQAAPGVASSGNEVDFFVKLVRLAPKAPWTAFAELDGLVFIFNLKVSLDGFRRKSLPSAARRVVCGDTHEVVSSRVQRLGGNRPVASFP